MAPNKIIEASQLISQGVSLIDHGKVIKGNDYEEEHKKSLAAYRKLSDPKA